MSNAVRLRVAAGILCDAAGRVLLAERLGEARWQGLWEFPGGKLAPGESAEQALRRELGEELGISVEEAASFAALDHDYPDRRVHLDFYLVTAWRGEPRGLEGQSLRWARPAEVDEAELLPANAEVIRKLRSAVSCPG